MYNMHNYFEMMQQSKGKKDNFRKNKYVFVLLMPLTSFVCFGDFFVVVVIFLKIKTKLEILLQ